MVNNLDGTYLDGDRRPRPLASAAPVTAEPPRPVSLWTRARRMLPYVTVAMTTTAAVLTCWFGQQWRWSWLTLVGLVFALAACTQIGVLVITGFDPDRARRRATFAAVNSTVMIVVDGAVLTVVAGAWWTEPSDLLRWLTAGVAVALLVDLALFRPWRFWSTHAG